MPAGNRPALIWRKTKTVRGMSLADGTSGAVRSILQPMRGSGKHPFDPRDLIHEAYRIEGIGPEECRAIFFDWAIGLDAGLDLVAAARQLHKDLGPANPDHPMTELLAQASHGMTPERGQARGRRRRH